jgi:hypothetical protein
MKLPIMQSSPASLHFLPLRTKYSHLPLLKHELCSSLSVRFKISHPYKSTGNIVVLCKCACVCVCMCVCVCVCVCVCRDTHTYARTNILQIWLVTSFLFT